MMTTWSALWWRVSLLARMQMRRARGAWILWRRHHRKARPVRVTLPSAHGIRGHDAYHCAETEGIVIANNYFTNATNYGISLGGSQCGPIYPNKVWIMDEQKP